MDLNSYSIDFVDAESAYRRDRTAQAWPTHRSAGRGRLAGRARALFGGVAALGTPSRRHRHA